MHVKIDDIVLLYPTLWLATLAPPFGDQSHAPSHDSGSRRELPSMCRRGRGLLPPVFYMPDGPGSMESGGGCSPRRVFGRGFLELHHRRRFQKGDGLEVSFRHVMGDMAPQE